MKIALITIWHEFNYGAEMQAYATIRALKEMGHDVRIIDIRLSDIRHYSLRGRITNRITQNYSPLSLKFNRFWKKNIPTTNRYHSLKELQKEPPFADLYLVGSDQVWNPDITRDLLFAFFLDFGGNSIRRAAYASSFGVQKWKGEQAVTSQIQTLLNRFDVLTCREKTGCDILWNTFSLTSTNVLDPTLLHNDYRELIGEVTEKQTLVYYPLSSFKELEYFAQSLAHEINLKFINTNKVSRLFGKILWNKPSVEQWIRNIAESTFVVTPSFHGIAFSIIYRKQFIFVMNPDGHGRISRITDLLTELGLLDRLFYTIDDARKSNIWEKKIDYSKVYVRLEALRQKSKISIKHILIDNS